MAIVTAAHCNRRNHGMPESWKQSCALATVIQRVFPKGLRQCIARRCAYRCDAEVGSEAPAVTGSPLPPLRHVAICLVHAGRECSAHDWIGAKCIEEVIAEPGLFRRTSIRQSQSRDRRTG